jgi:hypothetical protein
MRLEQDLKSLDQQIQTARRKLVSKDMTQGEFKILVSKLKKRRVKLIKEFGQKVKR